MKTYKKLLIITTIVTLIPMFIGFALWYQLPDQIATSFGLDNMVNGWSSKIFTVVGLPLLLSGIHLLCAFATASDPKFKNMEEKPYRFVLWICPGCSAFSAIIIYGYALGITLNIGSITNLLLGSLFLGLGCYMPRIKQNYTVGIKLPWTLEDEENWNQTHRFAGKVWIIGGALLLMNMVFCMEKVVITIIILMVVIPSIYSYLFYKNNKKE